MTKLIYQHCHSDAKERRVKIERKLTNGLDYDEVEEVIDIASEDLDFVEANSQYVWYKQNEDMILYIKQQTDHDLGIIGCEFSHLTPPSLRDRYDIPPPRH